LRAHLGLRLRDRVTLARRVHRLPPPQDRGRGGAPPRPHRARRRVRRAPVHIGWGGAGSMSLKWRIALGMAAIAALVSIVGATAAYLNTQDRLRSSLDESLLGKAHDI